MEHISNPCVKGIITRAIKSQLRYNLVSGNKAFYVYYKGYDLNERRHIWAIDVSERSYNAGEKCIPFARGKGLYVKKSEYMKGLKFKFTKNMSDYKMTKIAHNVINVYNKKIMN